MAVLKETGEEMDNWSIKIKLGFLCLFLVGTLVAVGLVGLKSTESVTQRVIDLSEVQIPAVKNMTLTDMMHDGLRAVVFKALYLSDHPNSDLKKEIAEEHKEMSTNIKKYLEEISGLNVRIETKNAIEDSRSEIDAYIQASDEIIALSLSARKDLAVLKLDAFEKSFSSLEKKLESLGELIEKDADASRETAKEIAEASKRTGIVLIILGFAFGVFCSIWFIVGISKSLVDIASHLAAFADQVTSASKQIALSSKDLSESSIEQAASLEQTASALEEITAMISKAADGAEITSESSIDSQKKAEDGRNAVDQMLSSMVEISQSSDAILDHINLSNMQISEIVKVIQEIGAKTKVINEIVFQTKLLSFNASVESARAGEHGKGFSVVAEEVGNLAQMSGNAAKEISDMLDASISKVESIVNETKSKVEGLVSSGRNRVEAGMGVARQCSEILNEIVKNVNRVSGLSQEISVATKEQAQGVSEINKAMAQLDSATQKNSTGSQETALAAIQLSEQANSLQTIVEYLLVIVNGRSSSVRSPTNLILNQRKITSLARKKNSKKSA